MIKEYDSSRTLWVVRHGYRIDFSDSHWVETADNPYNPPLAPVGFEQAAETAERLKNEKIDYIFTSPFLRTVQTANLIAQARGMKAIMESGLAEWMTVKDFDYEPSWEDTGKVIHTYPHVDSEPRNMVSPLFPEDSDALNRRIETTLSGLLERYKGNILLISHGSPLRAVFKALIGYEGEEFPSMASVSRFRFESGQWKLELNDDSGHLTNPDTTRMAFYRDRWAGLAGAEKERK